MAWAGVVGTLGARQRRWLVMLTVVATLFVPASAQPRIGFLWDEREYAPILAQEICYDEGLSATYVIGKAYEMIAGPLPARIMDKTLPFIQEAQDRGTLWGQRTVDKAVCESMLKLLRAKLHGFKVYSRWEQLSVCALEALSDLGSHNLGVGNLMGKIVTAGLASNLAHAYRHDPQLLCDVLAFPDIAEAIEPFLTLEDLPDDGDDDDVECEEGQTCANPSLKTVCTLSRWRSCRDAKPHEKELTSRQMNRKISEAVERGRVVFQEVLYEHFRSTVNDAYAWVLGRDVDESGVQRYVPIVAAGKQVEDVAEMLRGSKEFQTRCANGECLEMAEETVNELFREYLLRDADMEARKGYARLLQQRGSKQEVVNALLLSDEYQHLCQMNKIPCYKGKAMVDQAFKAILGRPPDAQGLMSYTRELVLERIDLEQLQSNLRRSDEYLARVDPRHHAQEVVEMVKRMFKVCNPQTGKLHHNQYDLPPAPANQAPSSLSIGRWCQRGSCEAEGANCGLFPLKAFQMVTSILWGRAPDDNMRQGGPEADKLLEKYVKATNEVITAYTSTLARFPDIGGVRFQVPKLISGEIVASQLVHALKMSEELQNRRQQAVGTVFKAAMGISTLARMFKEYHVQLPKSVKGCITNGYYSTGMPDAAKLLVCRGASQISETGDECLPEKLSREHCKDKSAGKRLCSAQGSKIPTETIEVLGKFTRWWKQPGYEMMPRQVIDVNGQVSKEETKLDSDVGTCASVGFVLRHLQEEWNRAGPLLGSKRVKEKERLSPIAIYVHERPHYFNQTMTALSRVRGINKTSVLVISIDSVNEQMLSFALNISFAPVRIIFHPVRDDLIRATPVLAIKDHWMFVQEMLWDVIPETKGMKDYLALLEEDHLVTPDYFELMDHLISVKKTRCHQCWGITMRWACRHVEDTDRKKICRSHHVINTGIIFNRTTYDLIRQSDFMTFPDGWDWSLFHLAQTGQIPDMMIGPAVSRISNIGTEGATVTASAGADKFLQDQLDYKADSGARIPPSAYTLDPSEMQYTPPGWEPLYVGSLGFVAALS